MESLSTAQKGSPALATGRWSNMVTSIFTSYLGKLVLIILCWLTLLTLFQALKRHRTSQSEARRFHAFAARNGCERTSRTIPYGFLPSLYNKLQLFTLRKTELLEDVFGHKFRTYGDTHALYNSYGTPKVIHTLDPDNVHAVLSSRSSDFGIPDARIAAIGPIGGHGVVMTEGALWAENRRIINTGFKGARYTEGIEEAIGMFFRNVSSSASVDGWSKPVTLFYALAHMSLDRSTKHMFGVSSGLQASASAVTPKELEASAPKQHILWKESFDVIAKYVGVRSLLGTKAWMYDGKEFRDACALLRKLCDEVIIRAVGHTEKSSNIQGSFVGNLVQENADTERIRDIVLDLFIAGHNMSAGTLSWLFFELERNPDIYNAVRQEVLEMFGTVSEPKAEMTWENLQKCKLLHGCVYESMRMYPMLPNIGRQAIRDTTLPTGGGDDGQSPVAVAKGTVVMVCVFLMHRRQQEYGAATSEFKPERWEGRNVGNAFAAFGAGPRVCPGLLFGLVEVFFVTAKMVQRFQAIRLAPGASEVKVQGAGVLVPPRTTVELQLAE